MTLDIALDELVGRQLECQGGSTCVIDAGSAVTFAEREHAEDATHARLAVLVVDGLAHDPDVLPCTRRAGEQL